MSSNAEIIFTGDAKGLLDEYKKLEAANKKLEEQLAKQVKVARDNARSEEKLRRDVMRAVEAARTPVEKYNAALAQYKTALDKGMISQAQFNSVQKAARAELDKSSESVLTFGQSLSNAVNKAALLRTGLQAVAAAAKAASEQEARMREDAFQANMTVDDMSRAYAIQAGIDNDADRVKSRDQIIEVARVNGMKLDKAFEAATQMAAMGITDAKSLDGFMKVMLTSNLKDASPKELVMASNQFLEASGIETTGENLMGLMVKMRGLFKDTQVEVADLTQFAQAAPAMSPYMGTDDMLGIMTALRQAMPASLASTAAKNITTRLTASAGTPATVDALAEMGLSPTDVDMVGESALEAIGRLRDGVRRLPKEAQASVVKEMFGLESGASASRLLDSLDKIPQYKESMKDIAGFTSGVNMALGSDSAARNREEITKQQTQLKDQEETRNFSLLKTQAETLRLERDMNSGPVGRTINRLLDAKDDLSFNLGLRTEEEYIRGAAGQGRGVVDTQTLTSGTRDAPLSGRRGSQQAFTEAELKSRLGRDPQMDKQTGVLQDISNKLTVRPVNPNLSGRP